MQVLYFDYLNVVRWHPQDDDVPIWRTGSKSYLVLYLYTRLHRYRLMDCYVDFAVSLLNSLRTRNIPPSLTTDLCGYLDDIPAGRSAAVASKFRDVDNYGTELWNLSAQLKRDGSAIAELVCLGMHILSVFGTRLELTSSVRVFACLLLDCAQGSTEGSPRSGSNINKPMRTADTFVDALRVFKITLRTTKHCLGLLLLHSIRFCGFDFG